MTTRKVPELLVPCISHDGALPAYANPGDSGFDISAAIPMPINLWPGHRKAIPTGLRVAVPEGWELQIRSRSGMSLNHGVVVANSPGTIDSGFRGEIKVILHNVDSHKPFLINPGDRIAQGVLAPIIKAMFVLVESLDETVRGEGGFGSSGIAGVVSE